LNEGRHDDRSRPVPNQIAKSIRRLASDHEGEVVAAFTAEGVPILRLEEAA